MAVSALLFLAASAAGAQAKTTAKAWRGLRHVAWDATPASWRSNHPHAGCVRFPHPLRPYQGDTDWSIACQSNATGYRARWFFYALDDRKPLAPHLEQFRASLTPHRDKADKIEQELEKRITAAYGPPERVDHARINEFGSAFWKSVRLWKTRRLEIYLYVNQFDDHPTTVELLARNHDLLAQRAEIRRLLRSPAVTGMANRKLIDAELARRLQPSFPQLAALLVEPPNKEDPNRVMDTLVPLLRESSSAAAGERPALMMAADSLAGHLWCRPYSACEAARKQLEGFGLTFRWSDLDDLWSYQHDLLPRVWKEFGSTAWGRDAFLLLNGDGWDTSGTCSAGTDMFHSVIEHSEKFLAGNPPRRMRVQTLFDLARAYETWWSLSLAVNNDYANPSKYQAGAEAARQNAISAYEQVVRLAPASDQAAYARLRLPRLKLGLDTGQRAYFCVYN
ncbi:MAG: hypothetical protein P8Z30_06790 [Acidobacteriota bacterium]